jgi:hypothetical protein
MKPATRLIVGFASGYWLVWLTARLVVLGLDWFEGVSFFFASTWFAASVFPLEDEEKEKP